MQDNNIEMYSIHNEGESVAAQIFIRTFKSKVYQYMSLMSANVYIYILDDMVNKYNNTFDRTIKNEVC